MDEETGNYYYGARYYDPKWSVWLSVDPMAEERPGISPYSYVQNNPLNRIDPTGMLDESVQRPDDWIKYLDTGEVKWFDGTSEEAMDAAQVYFGTESSENLENLGDSYFGPTKGNSYDRAQILDQRKSYLRDASDKINKNADWDIDKYDSNNITYEYLSHKFLGTQFGNKQNNDSPLPGIIWDYGGGDFVESKLPKNIVSKVLVKGVDMYFSSQPTALSADKTYMDRARAVNEFKTNTVKFIDMKTILNITLHKF